MVADTVVPPLKPFGGGGGIKNNHNSKHVYMFAYIAATHPQIYLCMYMYSMYKYIHIIKINHTTVSAEH